MRVFCLRSSSWEYTLKNDLFSRKHKTSKAENNDLKLISKAYKIFVERSEGDKKGLNIPAAAYWSTLSTINQGFVHLYDHVYWDLLCVIFLFEFTFCIIFLFVFSNFLIWSNFLCPGHRWTYLLCHFLICILVSSLLMWASLQCNNGTPAHTVPLYNITENKLSFHK